MEKRKKSKKWMRNNWNVEEAGHGTQARMRRDEAKHHSQFGGIKEEYLPKQILDGFPDGMARLNAHIHTLSEHPVERYRQLKKSKMIYDATNKEYLLLAQKMKDPEQAAKAIKHLKDHSEFFNDGLENELKKLRTEHKEILKYYTASDMLSKMPPEEASRLTKSIRTLFKPTKEEKE